MRPGWLRAFANGVLALSAADALFSLLDEVVRAATGAQWLARAAQRAGASSRWPRS